MLAGAAPAAADLKVDGRGFGHGIGMAQWGAYGYALKGHRSYSWILAHYYAGTRLTTMPSATIRVLLQQRPELLVAEATQLRSPGRSPITLHAGRTYSVTVSGSRLRVYDTYAKRTKATVAIPAVFAGSGTVRLRGGAQNGVMSGHYRGDILIRSDPLGLAAINRLDTESYLYGVVPAEMPSGWPAAALRTQAVAARTYAMRSLQSIAPFDVYADVRSQVYRGMTGEAARTTAAVRDTSRRVLFYGSALAATYFFSSSGGRTAAIDEEWGGPVVPYLQPVDDPYDSLSPYHRWTLTLTNADVQRRLGPLVSGDLTGIAVTARNSSGRVATVTITGTGGVTQATGPQIRTALGLRSTWFYLTYTAAIARARAAAISTR